MIVMITLGVVLTIEATRLAYGSGAGWIGAGVVGLIIGAASLGLLAFLFVTLRSPMLRLILAVIFAAPAAVAGYALVHGVTGDAVPSPVWRQIFCFAGGTLTCLSALARLAAAPSDSI